MSDKCDNVGFYLCDSARLLKKLFNRRAKDLAVTRSQWAVLWQLACGREVSQVELAELVEIEQPSLVRHVNHLERHGWITRKRDEKDKRINRICLTEAGQQLMDTACQYGIALRNEYMTGLSSEEQEQLRLLLAKIKDNLSRMDTESGQL